MRIFLSIVLVFHSCFSFAQTPAFERQEQTSAGKEVDQGPTDSLFWTPLVSLVLPGFGQYLDGETKTGLLMTGYYLVGSLGYVYYHDKKLDLWREANYRNDTPGINYDLIRDAEIASQFLGQMGMFAGELSLYDTFRRRVTRYQEYGQYTFLPKAQPVEELLMAPFDFSQFTKPSTYIPLAVGAGLVAAVLSVSKYNRVTGIDLALTGPISYQAGVGEEAMFRGWMYPVLYEKTSPWFANAVQSSIFAAAHLSATNKAPVFQFAAGWYLAYLTRSNNFNLSQSIFLHAWWDVFAVLAANSVSRSQAYEIRLPTFSYNF